jgi:hypothetical protein
MIPFCRGRYHSVTKLFLWYVWYCLRWRSDDRPVTCILHYLCSFKYRWWSAWRDDANSIDPCVPTTVFFGMPCGTAYDLANIDCTVTFRREGWRGTSSMPNSFVTVCGARRDDALNCYVQSRAAVMIKPTWLRDSSGRPLLFWHSAGNDADTRLRCVPMLMCSGMTRYFVLPVMVCLPMLPSHYYLWSGVPRIRRVPPDGATSAVPLHLRYPGTEGASVCCSLNCAAGTCVMFSFSATMLHSGVPCIRSYVSFVLRYRRQIRWYAACSGILVTFHLNPFSRAAGLLVSLFH